MIGTKSLAGHTKNNRIIILLNNLAPGHFVAATKMDDSKPVNPYLVFPTPHSDSNNTPTQPHRAAPVRSSPPSDAVSPNFDTA